MTSPALSSVKALEMLNRALGLDAAVTVHGDEIKCWVHDDDTANRRKAYFGADDCRQLGEAFAVLSKSLDPDAHQKGDDE